MSSVITSSGMATTYIIRAYSRRPIPTTLDNTVVELIRSAIELRNAVYYYANIINSYIEFKFQTLAGGGTAAEIMDSIIANLSPYNIIVDKYEIADLDSDTLSDSSNITDPSVTSPYIFGALGIIILSITLLIIYGMKAK